jgi:hypothetical protein
VHRRLDYLDGRLEIARDGASQARRFLLAGGLLRDHDSREILRVLVHAMNEPGEVRDPEGLRWDALTAILRIVASEETADSVVLDLAITVPTRSGWTRASQAYFSANWTGEASLDLQRLFDEAAGLSTELDEHAGRLLLPWRGCRSGREPRERWQTFLRKAGVVDHLRRVPAFTGPPPRANGGELIDTLLPRTSLPTDQRDAWRRLMVEEATLPNPFTPYTIADAFRLPGQVDHRAFTPIARRIYALEVIRALDEQPELARMQVYRPEHPGARNRHDWPSPVAAFLVEANWLPLASGGAIPTARAWLPGHGAMAPPGLEVVDHAVVSALMRHTKALDVLRTAGLSVFGEAAHAWRFLQAAAEIVHREPPLSDAERILTAATQAWLQASLPLAPVTLRLVGRQHGVVVATGLSVSGPPILVADGDDRQMVAANVRALPSSRPGHGPARSDSFSGSAILDGLHGRRRSR